MKRLGAIHDLGSMEVSRGFGAQLKFNGLPSVWRRPANTADTAEKSESAASDQQIDDEHDQQNTADTNAAAIPPPAIAETAPEEEDQYDNNQDQVHPLLR